MKYPKYEIFPSIVMPVGSGVTDNSGKEVEFVINEILAKKNGELQKVILKDFFPGVPEHYFIPMFISEFGTKKIEKEFKIRGFFKMRHSNRFTPENRSKTLVFLRERLINLGFSSDSIIVRKSSLIFDRNSKIIKSKSTVNESIIPLN